MDTAKYKLELRINGTLIGDIRHLAQNFTWVRRRTRIGVDEINFELNDVLFQKWCEERGTDVANLLKPLALDCRVVRNDVAVMGGFLATMPSYMANSASGTLSLRFDGYINYLAGVYIYPIGTLTQPADDMISGQIQMADTRAEEAGKAFGFTEGRMLLPTTIQQTFDNYISVKDFIANRCDNVTGAGPFDVFFHPDRTYDIVADGSFGTIHDDYVINYPTRINGVSATAISADEVEGFASSVIGIGSGEISSNPDENTAITTQQTNSEAVSEYGYYETIYQNSSIGRQEALEMNTEAELSNVSNPLWQPQITLTGRQINPIPAGERAIWVGDTIQIYNSADATGTMSGAFRVNELSVAVSATGAETITPTLERVV